MNRRGYKTKIKLYANPGLALSTLSTSAPRPTGGPRGRVWAPVGERPGQSDQMLE